jgi:CheY-like chemotaxis protein
MPIPERHHLLVVDDDESVREVFTLLLEKEGYVVTTANNGFDALLKLKKIAPEVIISDLNMPEMSGFEFLSVVRRRFPEFSVIASSGAYSSKVVPSGVLADAFLRQRRR